MIDLNAIPNEPGCYLYSDKQKNIIYIGKAKSLNKRVRSYFSKTHNDEKTTELVKEIDSVKYFVTSTEIEALILENTLIKKHKPKFNINLKDSQRYAYIAITNEKFPRLVVARHKNMDAQFFGPFTTAQDRDIIIKVLRERFQIRTCRKLPKKACLRHHLNLCSAPCIGNISETEYDNGIHTIQRFLKGNTKDTLKTMKKQMDEYAKNLNFEQAKLLRDQIFAIQYLNERQKVDKDIRYDQDVINYIIDGDTVYLMLFQVSRGVLSTKKEFSFTYTPEFMEDFLVQYYADNDVPKEIIAPQKIEDQAIKAYLRKLRKKPVQVTVPQKGSKFDLLELVKKNIEVQFLKQNKMLADLEKRLKLNVTPTVIECFDIAHIQGTSTTASMVQFRNAQPDKSNYRQFKIKTVDGNDDFASIAEAVSRRYSRLKDEGKQMPDLVVIDGGKGQLHAALDQLKELEIKIPIISLAKKFEEVYVPGLSKPLSIPQTSLGLQLLIQLRNEAHRFAQRYHKTLRSKNMLNEDQ